MGHKYTKILGTEAPHDAALYLGSIDWVIEDEILDDLQISAIVSVLPRQPQYADEVLKKHCIAECDYMVYPLEDSTDEYISLFEAPGVVAACNFIHDKRCEGKTVLVHCDAGVTRSPAVVVSYLMKYGTDLQQPKQLSLDEAAAIVRGLRERMDICAFHDELVRFEALLERGELSPKNATEQTPSLPRTPLHPQTWEELREAGDPWVELGILHSTWRSIRTLPGGQDEFGRTVYSNLFALGGQRMEEMYAEVDMQRLSAMMTAMLRQIVWSLDKQNLEHLVKFHRHLQVCTSDFETFHSAILQALRDKVGIPQDALNQWECFLRVVFNRWAKAIEQPLLSAELKPLPERPGSANAKWAPPGVCPYVPTAEDGEGGPRLGLPPRKTSK